MITSTKEEKRTLAEDIGKPAPDFNSDEQWLKTVGDRRTEAEGPTGFVEYPTYHSEQVNYQNYLELSDVLKAVKPISDEHSETLFIVAHQTTELWFKVLIKELNWIIEVPVRDTQEYQSKLDPRLHPHYSPLIRFKRIIKIFEHLSTLWLILTTLTPEEYEHFRGKLGTASGQQSRQYKEVERLLKQLPKRWGYKYKDNLLDIENAFKKWQFAHMKTVERIIGSKAGTGGTTGVEYLKTKVDTPLFPLDEDSAFWEEVYEWKGW